MSRFNKIEVSHQHQGQVLTLTLSSGRGNVLDREMISELMEVVRSEARCPDVKALVFQGKGEHFSYGASVPEHRREYAAEMLAGLHSLLRSMIDLSKPGVALVRCRRGKLWPARDWSGSVPAGGLSHSSLAGGPTGSR